MAKANDETTQPLDAAAVQKIAADAVAAAIKPLVDANKALTDNLKVIADTMAADKTAAEAAKSDAAKIADAEKTKGTPPKAITPEDVAKLVQDGITAALTKQQTVTQASAQRDAFAATNLKDVPKAYLAQLGTDPTKWAAEEQAIRGQLKTDLAALGVTVKDVGAGNPGGVTTSSATAAEKITQYKASGLTDGQAEFAATMPMPA